MDHQEILKQLNIPFPKQTDLNPASCRGVAIENKYPEFYAYLLKTFKGTFAEKMFLFYHNLETPPVCTVCGKPTAFMGMNRGYREFCSWNCMNSCPDIQERKKQTCLKNYGTVNPMECKEVRDKIKKTNQQRYGVDNAFQSKQLMEKAKQTCLEKYGTEYANQSEEVKKKILKSKRNNIMKNIPEILEILDGDTTDIYRMGCCDPNCNKCNEKYFDILSNHLYDRSRLNADPCTRRSPIGSHIKNTTLEIFIKNILDEYKIEYETNNRTILSGKELDIYIPSHNLAIECNGVYWHAMYDSEYHYNKWKTCKESNIQLLSIWEDWITNKPEIVRSLLLSKLGIYKERIYARNCEVKPVKPRDALKFLDDNHIQGKCNSKLKLGLYYNDELVSLMVFGYNSRKIMGKDTGWELLRFCSKLNIQVVGGAERLLSHFRNNHPDEQIISFASHDISNGNLYIKLGFVPVKEIHSIYWYVHNQTHHRYHRTSFTKNKLVKMGYDPSLTEEQIMATTDYLRIYDSGLTKYVLK